MLSIEEREEAANRLEEAEAKRCPIQALSDGYSDASLEDAYAIQFIQASRTLKSGSRQVGYKVGLTSREAQKQFGLFEPDFGHLFDRMRIKDGCIFQNELIQPKIEGEIAFVLEKELKGPGLTRADVERSVEYITAAFEIVDSRIESWKIKAFDTIADNGSSARFALSNEKKYLDNLDLKTIGMALSRNGEVEVTGAGAAAMGDPIHAVVFLANELGKHGRYFQSGDIILSGSLGKMISFSVGDTLTCDMWKLGTITLQVV